ncbi:MAG: c-type cytochrome [Polyangiaceae bacterium]
MRTSHLGRVAPCLFLLAAAIVPACSDGGGTNEAEQPGPPVTVPDIEPVAVSAGFSLVVDTGNPDLDGETLEPTAGPVTVSGGGESLGLSAFVKRLPARPEIVRVEVFIENLGEHALRDVNVEVGELPAGVELVNLTNDPFAEPTEGRSFSAGRAAKEGFAKVVFGVTDTGAEVEIPLSISATTTARAATSSAPIAVTPDGKEVWMAWPDGDLVAVVDTETDEREAVIEVEGRPSSVAVTPDGAFVLVAAAEASTVTVIDAATKEIVQTLGEEDGIGREPRHVVMSPDGGRAFVSAYVGESVASLVRNEKRFWFEKSTKVGRRPTGMSVSPDGGTLYVAHFLPRGTVTDNEAWMTVLATDPLAEVREVVFEDPFNTKQVKCLADVFGVSASRLTTEAVPTELWGVFLNPAGTEGWIPATRVAGATVVWERGPNSAELAATASIRTGELLAPFQLVIDTREAREAEVMQMPGVLDPPDVNLPYVKCARLGQEIELISRDLIPSEPGKQVNRAAAFPNGTTGLSETGIARFAAFSRGGRRMLTVSHMSDEIAVTDALTHHPTSQLHFQLSGSSPLGLALTPDGKKGYVVYESSTFASVLDLSSYSKTGALPGPSYVPYSLRDVADFPSAPGALTGKRLVRNIEGVAERPAIEEIGQIALAEADPMDAEMRRGKVLFSSANPDKHPTLSATRLGACASCHPDGGTDGSLWGTMEGERRTMSLRGGVAGRGWLHAMGTHADAAEFASIIVKERLGGELSEADTMALARYVSFGIPQLQAPVTDGALAAKGKEVFGQKCATCHQGAQTTSGNADPNNALGGGAEEGPYLYDVGTFSEDSHVILGTFFESLFPPLEAKLFKELRGDRELGPDDFVQQTLDFRARPARKATEYKAPSLTNAWDSALYFHDGRYDDLGDVIDHLDKHLGLGLSAGEKAAVIEYVKTL